MNISDEAVEAGLQGYGVEGDAHEWERKMITQILEAAAPYLMSAAWDEGYGAMVHNGFRDQELVKRGSRLDTNKATRNPYRVGARE